MIFAFLIKSYFKAFLRDISDIKIPLKPIFFSNDLFDYYFRKVETFLGQFWVNIWAVIANLALEDLKGKKSILFRIFLCNMTLGKVT